MRKVFCLISFLVLFINLDNAFALEFPFFGKVTSSGINLRAGPNIDYESLDRLEKEARVLVVSEKFGWYKIVLPEETICFISRKYVKKGIVTTDRVNLRAKPSEAATILGQVNTNYLVKIVKTYPNWYGISAPSDLVFGWIHKKFIDYYPEINTKVLQEETEVVVIEEEAESKEQEFTSKPDALGVIRPMGIFFRRIGTHKLMNNGKPTYYLKGDKGLLNRFIGYRVKIFGQIIPVPNRKIPLIEVERIEIVE